MMKLYKAVTLQYSFLSWETLKQYWFTENSRIYRQEKNKNDIRSMKQMILYSSLRTYLRK